MFLHWFWFPFLLVTLTPAILALAAIVALRRPEDAPRRRRVVRFTAVASAANAVGLWLGHTGGTMMAVGTAILGLLALAPGIAFLLWPRRVTAFFARWAVDSAKPRWEDIVGCRLGGVLAIFIGLNIPIGPIVVNLAHDRPWYFDYTAAARKPHISDVGPTGELVDEKDVGR